jgi:hypothetical protein
LSADPWISSFGDHSDDTQKAFMKSYCKNLVITQDHIKDAYKKWSKAQSGRKNQHRVYEEYGSPEKLFAELQHEINTRSLVLRPIRHYEYKEPVNGKIRILGIESVKQQVLDYLVIGALEQFLNAKIGYYQVASIKGKGQIFAAKTMRKWVQEGGYWVHLDVEQCYPSISHDVVLKILRKYVRSNDVLYISEVLLSNYDSGLDIGSYFSLKMSQLVLSFGYHHVETMAKTKRGKLSRLVSHQLWYADDIFLLSQSKRDLRIATRQLQRFLLSEFGLRLKSWKISKVDEQEPVDLVGFSIRPISTTIKSGIFLRSRRAISRYQKRPTVNRARAVCS